MRQFRSYSFTSHTDVEPTEMPVNDFFDAAREFSSLLITYSELLTACTLHNLQEVVAADHAYLSGGARPEVSPELPHHLEEELSILEHRLLLLERWRED